MKERPILFSAPMVRALLAGTKTQTRRIVTPQPECVEGATWVERDGLLHPCRDELCRGALDAIGPGIKCPYGVPGDRLWVKERLRESDHVDNVSRTSCLPDGGTVGFLEFFADSARLPCPSQVVPFDHQPWTPWQWRRPSLPSIHMPRWASRITLEVTDVRVERVQDISERDACAEGIGSPITRDCKKPKFMALWDQINGADPAKAWAANPWVWVVEFRRLP